MSYEPKHRGEPKVERPKCILCDRPAMEDHIICLYHYYDL